MSALQPINITLGVGGGVVSRVGFGSPLIVGGTGSRSVYRSGSGQSEIIFKSVVRQAALTIGLSVGSPFSYTLVGSDLIITVPTDTTVRELVADFDANAPAPVKAAFILKAGSLGLGVVEEISPIKTLTPLTGKVLIRDISQLDEYYDTTDAEYEMFQDQFNSVPNPSEKYLLDVFGAVDPAASVAAVDDGSWYALLYTSTTQSEQQVLAEYIVNVKRIALFVSDTVADAQVVKSQRIIYVIHDEPDDHPENAWAAKLLPNLPGSITWAFAENLAGQTPNATADLAALQAVRDARANSYVENQGLQYMDEGLTTEATIKTYIDQIRGRDWVELNLEADLLQLLVSVGKIPYTDGGIDQVVDVIANRLELAGDNGIIRPIENAEDAANSSSQNYVYNVTAPTRADVAENNPSDIVDRELNGITFSFEEGGAIHSIEAVGTVVIPQ